jgi:hypothetical protein
MDYCGAASVGTNGGQRTHNKQVSPMSSAWEGIGSLKEIEGREISGIVKRSRRRC